jgi:hypothetical protein
MPGKSDLFKEELDQLSDQEIDARLAAAVWVDDKRAAVLRYLEEKKLGRKKAEQSEELEIARSRGRMGGRGRGEGRTADGKTRIDYCRRGGGGSHRGSGSCGGHCLSETMKVAACPPWVSRDIRAPCFDVRKKVGSD